jgi:asparagine synthase (glutamine-hydrolysing)
MCGIYLTNFDRTTLQIKNDLKKIEFRGPDNLSVKKYNDSVYLAHLRLSIIDLDKRSNQPYEFDNLTITYNGEIYNFLTIKNELISQGYVFETESDTEVLIKAYHAWGQNMLSRLNGMFAFAIYDILNQKVFCARDRLGQKPFYYFWDKGKVEICSSPKSMHKATKISQQGINIYLSAGYIPSPFSIFENIKKLEAGKFLIFDLKKHTLEEKTYWDLKSLKRKSKITYDSAKEKLNDLVEDAVKIRMMSDVPIGSFLSGGVDSSLVSLIANNHAKNKLKTFTVKFSEKELDESEEANEFAKNIDSDHKSYLCDENELINSIDDLFVAFDEPFSDPAMIPMLMLCQKVKNETTVCLSGDGGDESFLGYNHFDWVKKFNPLFKIPRKIRILITPFFKPFLSKKHYDYLKNIFFLKNINDFIINIFLNFIVINKDNDLSWSKSYYHSLNKSKNIIQKTADINIKLWLEGNNNVKVDRSSMYSSVEIRNPFLDYRIVEFARELPLSYRYLGKNRKIILKDILKNKLDKIKLNKLKKGFTVPISKWIKGPLKDDIEKIFIEKELQKIPNLDYKKVIYYFKQHINGKADFSHIIWRVYVLFKWLKYNR